MHPNQFQVNEAWIVFKLNYTPIRTAQDGWFNCVCLMDAASCFLLGNVLAPVHESEPAQSEVRQLFKDAWQHKQEFPIRLFVPVGQFPTNVPEEAAAQGIDVVRVPEGQLMPFIREAKDGFKQYRQQSASPLPEFPDSGTFDPSLN